MPPSLRVNGVNVFKMLHPRLRDVLVKLGYRTPTLVQEKARNTPHDLGGGAIPEPLWLKAVSKGETAQSDYNIKSEARSH